MKSEAEKFICLKRDEEIEEFDELDLDALTDLPK
jgi:hypothetical protein